VAKAVEEHMVEAANPSQSDVPTNGAADRTMSPRASPAPPVTLSKTELTHVRETLTGEDLESRHFSMWGLLGVVTAASLVLAVGTYLPKSLFAGTVGMATLISMVALSAMTNPPAVLQVAWWVLLLLYLMAIGSAIRG
jgi:hypothetical protein